MNLHPMGNLKNDDHCLHHPMIHGGQEQGHGRGIDALTETPSRNKTRRADKTLMNATQSRPRRPKKSQISPKMSQTLALNRKMSGRVEKHDPTILLTSPVAGEKLDEPELAMRTGSFFSYVQLPPPIWPRLPFLCFW